MLRQQLEEEERKAIGQAKGEEMRSSAPPPPHQGAGTSKAAGGSGAPSSYVQLRECVENLSAAVNKSEALLRFTDHRVDALSGVVDTIVDQKRGALGDGSSGSAQNHPGGLASTWARQPQTGSYVSEVIADTHLRAEQLKLADEIARLI